MNKNFVLATGLLAGTIIGAGVFSLPYIFSRLGLAVGFFYLAAFALAYFIIHWMYAKILAAQDGDHQFFYLAHKYLGGKFANFASLIILGELVFVLVVYLILAPTFAELLFKGNTMILLLAFWLLGSVFIFVRLSWMGFADFAGTICILGIVGIIFYIGFGSPLEVSFFQKIDWKTFFLPFGPLLFSLAGRPAIHKVMEEYRRAKAGGNVFSLKRVVFWGTIIPALIYVFFIISVLKLNPNVSPEALNSLGFLSPIILALLGAMGLITLWTSYFMIGVNVKDILRTDLKYPKWVSAATVLFAPLVLYFAGFKEFLFVISFVGGVFLALEAIFVIIMWQKAFPENKWRWLAWPLYAVFATALSYEIFSFFN